MKINLNGEPKETKDGITVRELLEELGHAGRPVAVEVNRKVVTKAVHEERVLEPGDEVEVITFVGGG